jgi:predicted outer membrane repeat protein
MKHIYLKFLALIIFVSIAGMANAQTVRYVKPTATGTGNGLTWANATADLQAMITASALGDEIWVAAGTYLPLRRTNTTAGSGSLGGRDFAFVLSAGVKIYGGFAGTETLRSQRNVSTNVTILSGNLSDVLLTSDNAYHVVVGAGNMDGTVLDGFTITAGYGSSTFNMVINTYTIPRNNGSAIYLREVGSSLVLSNLIIDNNTSNGSGGAMYCHSSSPNISNVTFSNNSTIGSFDGGALFLFGSVAVSNPVLTNVSFISNSAGNNAGALRVSSLSNPTLNTVTFTNNTCLNSGGAMYIGTSATLTNVTFTGNSSGIGQSAGALFIAGSTTASLLTNVTFDANNSGSTGGAVLVSNSNPTFTNVTFNNNTASTSGGAVYVFSSTVASSPTFRNVNFTGNTAGTSGGALFTFGSTGFSSNPTLTNALFYNNTANGTTAGAGGGAIHVSDDSNLTISSATFYQNDSKFDGGAVFTAFTTSVMSLSNSILFGNTATNATKDIQNNGTGNLTIRNSITQIATTGVGNIIGDPLFTSVLPANSSFLRLDATSPGINAGDNTLLTAGVSTDFAGNTRIFDTTIDMGIYERQTTLPVELASFTAQKQNNSAVIKWVTLSEKNNAYFSLLKSNDGKTFSPVTKILPQGNGTSTASYSFVDHSPSNGVNYYQLVQIDNDGTKKDYGVKFLTFSLENELVKLYPNPTTDIVNVFISNKDYDTATLLAIDGKVLSTNSLTAGVNTALSLQDFPKGVYVVKLTGAKGVQIKKIIKL